MTKFKKIEDVISMLGNYGIDLVADRKNVPSLALMCMKCDEGSVLLDNGSYRTLISLIGHPFIKRHEKFGCSKEDD